MVVEQLISRFKDGKGKTRVFVLGAVYVSLALFLSAQVFRQYAGISAVFMVVLGGVFLFYKTIAEEEDEDFKAKTEGEAAKHHAKALAFVMTFFLGMLFAYTAWYVILPEQTAKEIYGPQLDTISNINRAGISGNVVGPEWFTRILSNNLKVLAITILFSFIYGAGALFILTWNASVIGAATGVLISAAIKGAQSAHLGTYLSAAWAGILRYAIHGIPEIAAYFIAAIAGGMISIAVIKGDLRKSRGEFIIKDVAIMIAVACVILFISALLEVYVTPLVA